MSTTSRVGRPPHTACVCAALCCLFAALTPVFASGQPVDLYVPGGTATTIAQSGQVYPPGNTLRTGLDQLFWFPGLVSGGTLYVNHERGTPNGGLSRLRYQDGAIIEVLPWVSGTHNNCSGNVSSWGTILSCEEFPSENPLTGWVLEVSPSFPDTFERLTALGRFSHESIVEDPVTGDFYMTDDSTTGVFFRFIPFVRGSLDTGTLLGYNADSDDWVLVNDPLQARASAINAGATPYPRLEDLVYHPGDDKIYIMATGVLETSSALGFILQFDPRTGEMVQWLDGDGYWMANPDNVEVDQHGNLLVMEDQYQDHIERYGNNELLLIRPDRGIRRIMRVRDSRAELTGLAWEGSDQHFFIDAMIGQTHSDELIDVVLPIGWNLPGTSVVSPAPPTAGLELSAGPNPFSGSTLLRALVPDASNATLSVHDTRGVLTRRFELRTGRFEHQWDGRDARGTELPAGIYFLTLETPTRSTTRKLVRLH